ncbi:MAG: hypothetical protein IH974_06560 [Myxococcales bacterium]|nr:hypothetical protein [Myxococcales bacterium]
MIRSLAIIGILLCTNATHVRAQSTTIAFDGTTGTAGTLDPTKPGDYDILDSAGIYDSSETNLFHSFEVFELRGGDTATFSAYQGNPSRVVVRVTRGTGTIVDGTLRSEIKDAFGNGADLIWIDPHGVDFKGHARLEVGGSALFSSAHELRFDDKTLEAAPENLGPIDVAMLSVAPSEFGFTGLAGNVLFVADAQGLGVPAGETLGFVGIDDSGQPGVTILRSSLSAQSSTIYIASAAGPTNIPLDPQDFDLGGYDPESLGAVSIQDSTKIEATSDPGDRPGEIVIRSGSFTMAGSTLVASNAASAVSPGTSIDIAVSRDFKLDPGAQIRSVSDGGHAGDVSITGGKFEMQGGSGPLGPLTQIIVGSMPTSSAAGPDLYLRASTIELDDKARLVTSAGNDKPGGAIYIDTDSFTMAGGSDLVSLANGGGRGGEIKITATESVQLSDPSLFGLGTVATHSFSTGPAGNLTINSGTLSLENLAVVESIAWDGGPGGTIQLHADTVEVTGGSWVLSETKGAAPGGAIEIDADAVVVAGSAGEVATILARAGAAATGDGGAIEIHTTSLDVLDGGLISSDTLGLGNAGGIAIHGRGPEEDTRALRVTVEGGPTGITAISSNTASLSRKGPGDANGGNIVVDVDRLELVNGGFLTVSTSGPGDAGAIDVRAGIVEIRGEDPMNNNSGVFAQSNAQLETGGGGGGITINTDGDLTVSDHGVISVSTSGGGDAGLIDLIVGGTLLLSGPGGNRGNVEASHRATDAAGSPGDIQIAAALAVRLLDGATITTESLGPADAGNITIDAGRRFEAIGSKVTTAANEASGGQVSITASELVYLLDSEVSTDVAVAGAGGGGGDVMIGDPETVVPEFVVLNEGRISASARDGAGGRIDIETGTFFASAPFAINPGSPPDSGSFLDATSDIPELTGTVNVEPPETELVTELASLPAAFLDASALLGSACETRTSRAGSFQVQRYAADLAPPDAALAPVGLHQTPGIRVLPVGRDLCASPEETL